MVGMLPEGYLKDKDDEVIYWVTRAAGPAALAVVSGVVCIVKRHKDGQISVAPITQTVAKDLGLTKDRDIASFIAKQNKDAQALLQSGKLYDPDWLKEHVRFEGKDLGNFPRKVLQNIQESLKYPTAQRRLADLFANPQGTGILTYRLVDMADSHAGAGGYMDIGAGVQGVRREAIGADWFLKFTDPHEITHGGQMTLLPASFSAREAIVYEDVIEAMARIEEFCNGVIENRNLDGRGSPNCKNLVQILNEVDSNMSWSEFVAMQKSNPEKFNLYMNRIKELSFKDIMASLPKTELYTNQFLRYAINQRGEGDIKGLRLLCEHYAEKKGIDFNAIWPTVEGYATGKIPIPDLERYIRRSKGRYGAPAGRLNAMAYEGIGLATYNLMQDELKQATDKRTIQMLQNKINKFRQSHIMHSPLMKDLVATHGLEWVNQNYDEIVRSFHNALASGVSQKFREIGVVEDSKGPLVKCEFDSGEIISFDDKGRARLIEYPVSNKEYVRTEINYDAKGKRSTKLFLRSGKQISGASLSIPAERMYQDWNRPVDKAVRAAYDRAPDHYDDAFGSLISWWRQGMGMRDPVEIGNTAQSPKARRASPKAPEPVVPPPKARRSASHVASRPIATPKGNPTREVIGGVVRLGGQVWGMYKAGEVGQLFRDWEKAKEQNRVGELMGISPNTTKAMQKADELLGYAGLAVMGSGVVLTVGKAIGKEALETAAGKVAAKSVPWVGTVLGIGYAGRRAWDGDWTGVGLELTSAALDVVSGVGALASTTGVGAVGGIPLTTWATGASLTLDSYIAFRDSMMKEGECDFAMVDDKGNQVSVVGKDGKPAPVLGARINYKHNVREGDAVFYGFGKNGSYPAVIGSYKDDKKDGQWIAVSPEWDSKNPTEHVLEIANYKDGQLIGEYVRRDANGELIAAGNVTAGSYEEYWTDENGLSTGIRRYVGECKDGQMVQVMKFDENGIPYEMVDYQKREIQRLGKDENGDMTVSEIVPFELPVFEAPRGYYPSRLDASAEAIAANSVHNPVPVINEGIFGKPNPEARSARDPIGAREVSGENVPKVEDAKQYSFVTYTDKYGVQHRGYYGVHDHNLYVCDENNRLGERIGEVSTRRSRDSSGRDVYTTEVMNGTYTISGPMNQFVVPNVGGEPIESDEKILTGEDMERDRYFKGTLEETEALMGEIYSDFYASRVEPVVGVVRKAGKVLEKRRRETSDRTETKPYYGHRPGGIDDTLMAMNDKERTKMVSHRKQKGPHKA